ncbi:uncharacterized protein LOC120445237 isoform X2 [Drosophila santomea]|nr:uncharacterized protein LOC120445237 isoform X2 [Drosophila santomea]
MRVMWQSLRCPEPRLVCAVLCCFLLFCAFLWDTVVFVPESDFMLEARMSGSRMDVDVMCAVQHVFPQPMLSVMFDTHILDSVLTQLDQDPSGLYSMTVRTRIPRDQLASPTPITCAFILVGTNYTKRRETIFYDKASTIQRKWTTVAVVMSIASLALSS